MDPAKAHKKRGRKTAAIVTRKGLVIARQGLTSTHAGGQALLKCLSMIRTAYWVAHVAGYDDAANSAETVLTAIVRYLGEILACLIN